MPDPNGKKKDPAVGPDPSDDAVAAALKLIEMGLDPKAPAGVGPDPSADARAAAIKFGQMGLAPGQDTRATTGDLTQIARLGRSMQALGGIDDALGFDRISGAPEGLPTGLESVIGGGMVSELEDTPLPDTEEGIRAEIAQLDKEDALDAQDVGPEVGGAPVQAAPQDAVLQAGPAGPPSVEDILAQVAQAREGVAGRELQLPEAAPQENFLTKALRSIVGGASDVLTAGSGVDTDLQRRFAAETRGEEDRARGTALGRFKILQDQIAERSKAAREAGSSKLAELLLPEKLREERINTQLSQQSRAQKLERGALENQLFLRELGVGEDSELTDEERIAKIRAVSSLGEGFQDKLRENADTVRVTNTDLDEKEIVRLATRLTLQDEKKVLKGQLDNTFTNSLRLAAGSAGKFLTSPIEFFTRGPGALLEEATKEQLLETRQRLKDIDHLQQGK